MKLRKGIHNQIERIYYAVLDGIGRSKHHEKISNLQKRGKLESDLIHSVSTRRAYLRNMHLFGEFLKSKGVSSLLEFDVEFVGEYLSQRLAHLRQKRGSYGSFQQEVAALRKLFRGIELYATERGFSLGLDLLAIHSLINEKVEDAGQQIISPGSKSKPGLRKSPWYHKFGSRKYESPEDVIACLREPSHILQASIQLEGGCRAEGVGAVGKKSIPNPLTSKNLKGLCEDPVNGEEVGSLYTIEKGGKGAFHFVSKNLYEDLNEYLEVFGRLESDYFQYLYEIKKAARVTGQYHPGRGSHGFRHNFAYRRYHECLSNEYTNLEAKACVSAELNHNRLDITDTYLGN